MSKLILKKYEKLGFCWRRFFRLNNVVVVSAVLMTANMDPYIGECIEISMENLYVGLKGVFLFLF